MVFTMIWDVGPYRYQPISHSVQWFLLRYETYIGISLYHTLCSGIHYGMRWISVSVCITLCAMVSTMIWDVHWYQPISHYVQWFSLWDVYWYQPISHYVQWFSLWDVYRHQPISHSVQWFSRWDVYWWQPISFYSLNYNAGRLCHVTWSCEKIITLFYFSYYLGQYSTCPMNQVWLCCIFVLYRTIQNMSNESGVVVLYFTILHWNAPVTLIARGSTLVVIIWRLSTSDSDA